MPLLSPEDWSAIRLTLELAGITTVLLLVLCLLAVLRGLLALRGLLPRAQDRRRGISAGLPVR